MTDWDAARLEAEQAGFKFEWQEWIPDDYNNEGKLITQTVGQWKVIYPNTWPAWWIDDNDTDALHYILAEYGRREEIARETAEHNRAVVQAVSKWGDLLKTLNK